MVSRAFVCLPLKRSYRLHRTMDTSPMPRAPHGAALERRDTPDRLALPGTKRSMTSVDGEADPPHETVAQVSTSLTIFLLAPAQLASAGHKATRARARGARGPSRGGSPPRPVAPPARDRTGPPRIAHHREQRAQLLRPDHTTAAKVRDAGTWGQPASSCNDCMGDCAARRGRRCNERGQTLGRGKEARRWRHATP